MGLARSLTIPPDKPGVRNHTYNETASASASVKEIIFYRSLACWLLVSIRFRGICADANTNTGNL